MKIQSYITISFILLTGCAGTQGSKTYMANGPSKTEIVYAPAPEKTACEKSEDFVRQGMIFARLNNLKDSELEFKKALQLCRTNAKAYLNLGVIYIQQKKYSMAENNLRMAISSCNKNAATIRANIQTIQKEKSRAEESYRKLRRLTALVRSGKPAGFSLQHLLIISKKIAEYSQGGGFSSDSFNHFLLASRKINEAINQLAEIKTNSTNIVFSPEEKVQIEIKLTKMERQLAKINDQLARIQKEKQAHMKEMIRIPPLAHYNLAAIYSLTGHTDRSLEELNTTLELGFKNKETLEKDADLYNVRQRPEFKSLLVKYGIFR